MIPEKYQWLEKEGAPRMLVEGLKLYGTKEIPGAKRNAVIMQWAKEVGIPGTVYTNDDTAWCGLFMAVVVKRSGREPVAQPLWARNWAKWGVSAPFAMLGDILVFSRKGKGGHVGVYVGEDDQCYHVLGGNQSNMVNVTRIEKSRCIAIRRPNYTNMPANVRVIKLESDGEVSINEA